MSRRTLWGAAAVALTLLLGAAALLLTPVDRAGYRTAAATAAQDSLSAVRTLARTAEARLDGRVTAAYIRVTVAAARAAVAAPPRDLAGETIPDEASRAVRDQVLPLLAEAVVAVGDAGLALAAGDRARIRAAVTALDSTGDRLATAVDGLR